MGLRFNVTKNGSSTCELLPEILHEYPIGNWNQGPEQILLHIIFCNPKILVIAQK